MKRLPLRLFWLFVPLLICGCVKEKDEAKKAAEKEMNDMTMESIQKEGKRVELTPGVIQITPERQQLFGVKFGTAEMKPLAEVIRTVGRVDYDEKRVMAVSPKIGGWIEELYVDFTGQFVRKGDPLLTIYSPELVTTQEEYLLALRAKKSLIKSTFPEAASGSDSLAESAKRRLKLWDISEDQIKALEEKGQVQKTLTLYCPFTGFVLEKFAYKGMNVTPGMALYKIADLSVVWIYADIYQHELPFIRLGQEASVQLTYIPRETFSGKIIYIYPSLNPETRTARVRFEFPNLHDRLKLDMYVTVETKVPLGHKLTVPEEAIVDTGTRYIAFVDKGSGYFEAKEVRVGSKVDGYYEVIEGLKMGERVVTSSNFLVDSESNLSEAVEWMRGKPRTKHRSLK